MGGSTLRLVKGYELPLQYAEKHFMTGGLVGRSLDHNDAKLKSEDILVRDMRE